MTINKMWQIFFTVFLINLNSCEASCFGKDAHFKTTDVRKLQNVIKIIIITQMFNFSNLW